MADDATPEIRATPRKPSFPIGTELRGYLRRYKRERDLPVTYERLLGFREVIGFDNEAIRNSAFGCTRSPFSGSASP